MMRKVVAIGVMIASWLSIDLCAQNLNLDFQSLDTGKVVLSQASQTDTLSSDSVIHVAVGQSGEIQVDLLRGQAKQGRVKLQVDGSGNVTGVLYKASGTSQFVPLNANLVEINASTNKVKFKDCAVHIDLSDLDFAGAEVFYVDKEAGKSKKAKDLTGLGIYDLFPGFYEIRSAVGDFAVEFDLGPDCIIDQNVSWKGGSDPNVQWELLHADAYSVSGNQLVLNGFDVGVEVSLESGQGALLEGIAAGLANLGSEVETPVSLFPGRYEIAITENGVEVARLQYEVLNATDRLSSTILWKDLAGNQTNGEFVPLEEGLVYITPERFSSGVSFPLALTTTANMPYAVLKDNLDGGYFRAVNGELKLRYDERYNESNDLNLKIYDQNHEEVALSSPVARHYGANWITLSLPASSFAVGQYYVLEVKSEKGDLGKLRFRYDQ